MQRKLIVVVRNIIRKTMMVNKYKEAFRKLGSGEPNPRIFQAVLSRIEEEEARQAKKAAAVNVALAALSFFAAIYLAKHFIDASYVSGFQTYLSLAWSDASFVLANLNTYLETLASSLPLNDLLGIGLVALAITYCIRNALASRASLADELFLMRTAK